MRVFTMITAVGMASATKYTIDCDSGTPDSNTALESLTAAVCISACETRCLGEEDLDGITECLKDTQLVGCLFDILAVDDYEAEFECINNTADSPHVIFTIPAETLTRDGVSAVSLAEAELRLSNGAEVTALCTLSTVQVGIARTVDTTDCSYDGTVVQTSSFTHDNENLRFDISQAVPLNTGSAVSVFAQFSDPECGAMLVNSVNVSIGFAFRDGYRPTVECSELSDSCIGCLAVGCSYCDWSSAVDVLLPSFLPDWDWINNARESDTGVCGMNSALCKATVGRVNTCGAESTLTTSFILTASLLAVWKFM